MQVAGDPFAVGDHVEFAHPVLRAGQLPGQGGLIGESRHHLQLFVGELRGASTLQDHHHPGDGLGGSQRQHHRGPGVADQCHDVGRGVESAWSTAGEGGADRTVRDGQRWPPFGWAVPAHRLAHQQLRHIGHRPLGVGGHGDQRHIGPAEVLCALGDEPKCFPRLGTAEQLGGDVAGRFDPRLPGPGLRIRAQEAGPAILAFDHPAQLGACLGDQSHQIGIFR